MAITSYEHPLAGVTIAEVLAAALGAALWLSEPGLVDVHPVGLRFDPVTLADSVSGLPRAAVRQGGTFPARCVSRTDILAVRLARCCLA